MWNFILGIFSKVPGRAGDEGTTSGNRPRIDAARTASPAAGGSVLSGRLLLFAVVCGCSSTPASAPKETAPVSRSGTEMPESLRCRKAEDCVQKPSCYWETPACVAAVSVAEEKCGEDADPTNKDYPPVACDCFEGQCVPK